MSQPPFQPPQAPPGPPQGMGSYPTGASAPPGAPYSAQPPYAAGPGAPPPSSARRHDRSGREGAITAGVWLIAIGLVFLVRDWAGWSWGQAWPLFVIAAAGASFVTSLLHRSSLDAGSWSLMWPIAWLVIGVVLLAATTGNLGADLGDLISRWWPVGLILVGAWFLVAAVWPGRRRPVESLTLPLGPSPGASIKLSFGGGVLEVGRATPGSLVSGTFQGGVRYRTHGPDTAELEPDTGRGWPMAGAAFRWARLTGEKPLDLGWTPVRCRHRRLRTCSSTGSRSTAGPPTRDPAAARAGRRRAHPTPVSHPCSSRFHPVSPLANPLDHGAGARDIDERRFPARGRRLGSPDFATRRTAPTWRSWAGWGPDHPLPSSDRGWWIADVRRVRAMAYRMRWRALPAAASTSPGATLRTCGAGPGRRS